MHGWRPAARYDERVEGALGADELDRLDAVATDDAFYLRTCDAKICRGRLVARIENLDLGAGFGQRFGHGIGGIIVGRDGDALAYPHGVASEIDERSVGGHHAGAVVVGEDERALDGAGRDHDTLRPYAPERVGRGFAPFPDLHEIVIVDAECGCGGQHASAPRFDRGGCGVRPLAPVALDDAAAMEELAADLGVVVDQDHDCAPPCGRARGGESRWAGADDEQIAMGVICWTVGGRDVTWVEAAKTRHGANRGLESLPARPEESFVIEACRQER